MAIRSRTPPDLELVDSPETKAPIQLADLRGKRQIAAEVIALAYIAIIAEVAIASGAFYILFPELAALSHDIFTRPRGSWASAPVLLVITPVLTAVLGTLVTRSLPYDYVSVMLTVCGSLGIILALRSPIAPAISAGLLPLTLGVRSLWYPAGIVFGTTLLALLSFFWKQMNGRSKHDRCQRGRGHIPRCRIVLAPDPAPGAGPGCSVCRQANEFAVRALPAVSRDRIRDVPTYEALSLGDADPELACSLYAHRCGWAVLSLVPGGRSVGVALQYGVGNPDTARFRSSRSARARGRVAAAGDRVAYGVVSGRRGYRHFAP